MAVIVAGSVLTVLGASGVALAYVSSAGQGAGSASVTTSGDVSASAGRGAAIYPGAAAALVDVAIANPEALPLTVTSLQPDLRDLPAGCPATAWSISPPAELPTVPAHGRAVAHVTVRLLQGAPATCQGASLPVTVTIEGHLG